MSAGPLEPSASQSSALPTPRLPLLGVAETAIHALIDHNKCARRISLRTDQILHLSCKALWVAILAAV